MIQTELKKPAGKRRTLTLPAELQLRLQNTIPIQAEQTRFLNGIIIFMIHRKADFRHLSVPLNLQTAHAYTRNRILFRHTTVLPMQDSLFLPTVTPLVTYGFMTTSTEQMQNTFLWEQKLLKYGEKRLK